MNNLTGNFKNSNIISSTGSNININTGNGNTERKNKKKDKKNNKKAKKEREIMLSSLTEQIINNLADGIVNITEVFPETKEFARKQNAILLAISGINTFEKVSERKILYNKEFLENFAEIDFSNKSYKEGDQI